MADSHGKPPSNRVSQTGILLYQLIPFGKLMLQFTIKTLAVVTRIQYPMVNAMLLCACEAVLILTGYFTTTVKTLAQIHVTTDAHFGPIGHPLTTPRTRNIPVLVSYLIFFHASIITHLEAKVKSFFDVTDT